MKKEMGNGDREEVRGAVAAFESKSDKARRGGRSLRNNKAHLTETCWGAHSTKRTRLPLQENRRG